MTLPSPSCLKSAKFTISSGRESKGGKKSSPNAATTLNRDPKPMRKALSIPAWGTSATEGKNRGSHRAGLGPAQVPDGCAWLGGAGTHRPVLAPAGTQGWVRATFTSHLLPCALVCGPLQRASPRSCYNDECVHGSDAHIYMVLVWGSSVREQGRGLGCVCVRG